ncbi:hypothetical protein D918_03259 [Trichuris suis]|nr:hypothetical protein D918_03259 [Trichuris suis]
MEFLYCLYAVRSRVNIQSFREDTVAKNFSRTLERQPLTRLEDRRAHLLAFLGLCFNPVAVYVLSSEH